MKKRSKPENDKRISAVEFDEMFDSGQDISRYLDTANAIVVKRVNVDFPTWMIEQLDTQALRLNVSRQAIIKMWIHDRLRELALSGQRPHSVL